MEKAISTIAFIIITATSWAQSSIWGEEYNRFPKPKTRIDTICGKIVYIDSIFMEALGPNGWYKYGAGEAVAIAMGMRIDSIVSYYGEIPCPQGLVGCAVYHMGWVDIVKSSRFCFLSGEAIEEKNVIHFSTK